MKMIYSAIIFSLVCIADADLPIHCVRTKVTGTWAIHMAYHDVPDPSQCKSLSATEFDKSWTIEVRLLSTPVNSAVRLDSTLGLVYRALAGKRDAAWTMVYDEGLVIRIDGLSPRVLYGQFEYAALPGAVRRSPFVEPDGTTPGYESHCSVIPSGWVIRHQPDGSTTTSCFTARQTSNEEVDIGTDAVAIRPHLRVRSPLPDSFAIPIPANIYSHRQSSKCGSCYVLAYAFAFERTLMTHYTRIAGEPTTIQLDREAMLACSYSAKGCDGGYFSSLSLDLSVTGVPSTGCQDIPPFPLSVTAGKAQTCNRECYSDKSTLFYTKGFVELQSEEEVMRFLQTNGPVPVGINVRNRSHADYSSSSEVYEVVRVPGVDREPTWDYVNHGVVFTGWGVDTATGVHYWTAYNPWGHQMKIKRGEGQEWITKYAVGIVPDMCRGRMRALLEGKDVTECPHPKEDDN